MIVSLNVSLLIILAVPVHIFLLNGHRRLTKEKFYGILYVDGWHANLNALYFFRTIMTLLYMLCK